MTFDGRARNRYVNFSRDVVPLVRLKGLTLIVHYRRETPRNRRPVEKNSSLLFHFEEKKEKSKERQNNIPINRIPINPTTNGKGSKRRVAVC